MRILLFAFFVPLFFAAFTPHTLLAKRQESKGPLYARNLKMLYAEAGATSVYHCSTSGVDIIKFAPFVDINEALKTIQKSNLVEFAERDPVYHAFKTPNDPDLGQCWGLNNTENPGVDIEAGKAWDLATGSSEVLVAVIDTGADYNHIDLKQNIWTNKKEIPDNGIDDDKNGFVDDYNGYDFINNKPHPEDDNGHGTHCSGTIGATGNNRIGIAGVNWKVRIMALKFLDAQGSGSGADAIKCLDYAVKMGVHVTSNSYGGDEYSEAMLAQLKACKKANQLFVVAAGNDGKDIDADPVYPASYKVENVLPVAAHDSSDQLADFSNYGAATVPIAAPGVDIYSLAPGGDYATMSGTSMACPHVAGIAALTLSYAPALKTDVVKLRKLMASEEAVNKGDAYEGKVTTGGRISAFKLLKIAK